VRLTVVAAIGLLSVAGCGGRARSDVVKLRPDQRPAPIGRGRAYRLGTVSPAVARQARIAGMSCSSAHGQTYGVHLELYAHGRVLPVPAGIGIAPPQRRRGPYRLGGRCSYPLRTFEPTGVVVVDAGRPPTLGTLFAVWGQELSHHGMAGFDGRVLAFVDGRRWRAAPGSIRLRHHAEIVLEIDGYVLPHPRYRFPPGL
jgi:hypothetical protein